VITDLGTEFTGGRFRAAVRRIGSQHRFASAENLYATARLERFWLTLKNSARLRLLGLPLTREDLERRLEAALSHYILYRPHEGLGGAVPAEALLGIEGPHVQAVEAPRGRHGDPPETAPFLIGALDDAGFFPILKAA
jgi:transposase InsO family protein